MIEIYQRIQGPQSEEADHRLLLTHDERCRARLKTETTDGTSVGVFLPHGQPLTIGEHLLSDCGQTLCIDGAAEPIVSASCDDPLLFARACYHLGNRHVKIQIAERILHITPDSVLEDMLVMLGLNVRTEHAIFIPESGAYHGKAHSHEH
jgi:urease accessory protein